MKINRREFIALSLASGAIPSAWAEETPLFTVGMMTDTHVTPDPRSFTRVRQAYELFKSLRVDMISNVGDIADHFYPEAYDQYRKIRETTYPDPASRPAETYCWANHDWYGYPHPDDGQHMNCYAVVRERLGITHEPYAKMKFAGFTFLVFPLIHDRRCEQMLDEACKESPDRPVIVFDHSPPSDTVYGTAGWGSGGIRGLLEKYPNVIHISGHTHGSARNEMQIWQGAFTCVNVGSLTYFGDVYAGNLEEWGQSHTVIVMRMFPSRIEFRRYSLVDGAEISPDRVWSVTWPLAAAQAPYAPENRLRTLPLPQYVPGSELGCEITGGKVRVKLPAAVDRRDLHQHRLTIERSEDGAWRRLSVQYSRGDYWCERPSEFRKEIIVDRLLFREGGEYRLTLEPIGFWDGVGKALVRTVKFDEYAPKPLWCGMPEGFERGVWRKLGDSANAIPPFLPEEDRKWVKILVEVSVKDVPGALIELRAGVHWPSPHVLIPDGVDRMRFVVPYPRMMYSELLSVALARTRKAMFRFDEFTIYPCPDEEGDEWAHGMVRSFKAGDGVH